MEVRRRADVALVGRERKDGHRDLLVLVLLDANVGPLQREISQ